MEKHPSKVIVSITDDLGRELNKFEYDLIPIICSLRKNLKKNGELSMLAVRDLAFIGSEGGEIIGKELRNLIQERLYED